MRARLSVVLLLVLLALPASAAGETLKQAYDAALKDYYAGRYSEAVAGFERLLAVPLENEDLHYNLGCAHYKLDELGPAIYHFERALVLDPGDEDARFNLQTARELAQKRVKDEIKGATGEAWWARLVRRLGAGSWAVVFLALWWASLGLLLGLRFVSPGAARAGLIAGTSLLGVLTLIGGLLLAGRIYLDTMVSSGIVLPDKVSVREGPDQATKVSFTLHAGLKVRLQAQESGWVRIRLPNGLEGWLPQREVGRL